MDYFFGDSMTHNPPQMVSFYPWLYAHAKGQYPCVKAVPGSCAADVADQIFSTSFASCDRAFLMLGNNDRQKYGLAPPKLALFDSVLRALAFYATHNIVSCRSSAWAYSGTWVSWDAFGLNPFTQCTNQNDATATVKFTGDSFDLSYVVNDFDPSGFNISVDGGAVQYVSCTPPCTVATKNLRTYAPFLLHKSGYGSGVHTLKITAVITGSNWIYLNWLGGAANGVVMNFLSAPRSLLDADALTIAYNAQLAASALAGGVGFIDTCSVVDPNNDLVPGEVHMHMGHFNVATLLHRAC